MKKFDLKKAILENKATFHSSLSENESTYEGKKSKKYYKDAEADDAEHIKALEKDMKDDKKASKKLKENLNTPTSVPELIFQIQKKYPKMNWLESELPNNPTFQDVKGTLEDFGYGRVYDEFMGGDMDDIMTDLNETNTKMKVSELKAKIKEMIVAEMDGPAVEDSQYDFLAELEEMLNESPMNDPRLKQVIQMLIDMDVDGETMEYILRQVGMEDQMANQLVNYPAEYAASLKEMELFPLVGNEDYDKGDHFFDIVADTKFEDALYAFKKEGFTLEDITGWIEAHWNRINEAEETEKDTAETDTEETTTDTETADVETTDVTTTAEVDPNVKAVQDSLTQAQAAAQALGDKKLIDQIGNTITFFTRAHVVEKPKAVAEVKALQEKLLLQKKAGIISETEYKKKLNELETSAGKYYSKDKFNNDFFEEFGDYVIFSAPVPPSDMDDDDEMSTSYFLVKPETAEDNSKVDKFMELTYRRALRNKKVKIGTPNKNSSILKLSIPSIYVEK